MHYKTIMLELLRQHPALRRDLHNGKQWLSALDRHASALTSSTWSVTGIDAEGKPFTGKGKSMEVVRRQADGTWRFVIDNPHGGE